MHAVSKVDPDTIAAIATAPGPGSVAILRVSGPQAPDVAGRLFRATDERPLSAHPPRTAVSGRVIGAAGEPLDDVLALSFPAPRSYTGEHVVEIHGHGGAVMPRRILRRALECGARLAEPGEFTRRAFLNGKMDLVQAEAVADLLRAQSDQAASLALEQLNGRLSSSFRMIYEQLVSAASRLEAALDFPEEDLPAEVFDQALGETDDAVQGMRALLETWAEGRIVREGARVVIAGKPNSGKSTLFNALVGSERAIVSHIPGTTRDTIEEHVQIDGLHVRLVDTAGLRETECQIEQEGVRRALAHAGEADLVLHVIDATDEAGFVAEPDTGMPAARARLVVINKVDALPALPADSHPYPARAPQVRISARTGLGMEELRHRIRQSIEQGVVGGVGHACAISERHRDALRRGLTDAASAAACLRDNYDEGVERAIHHLRAAAESAGEIIGRNYTDDLLDSIFLKFCIGK